MPVRIAKRAGGGVALGGLGFVPTHSTEDAPAVAFADKAYFANTQKDTDFMVSAVPFGAEASWVLRSVQSPERLGLDLRLARGESLIVDPDRPAGAAVKRAGETIARIAPPTAVDADGKAVPASYDLAGSELRVKVDHRDRDLKYPLIVDPYFAVIYGRGPNGNPNTFAGWSPNRNCGMLQFGSVSTAPQLAYFPPGGVSAGCFGVWAYVAPGSAYVFEADFANLNHWGSAGNGAWYGILNADGSVPPGGSTYTNGNDPPVAPQPLYENAPLVGAARRVCTTAYDNNGQICPQSVGNPGNVTFFGIYNAVSQAYTSNQSAFVYGTTLYMSDKAPAKPPTITGLPTDWTSTVPGSFKVTSTQGGIGINSFGVTFPGGGYPTRSVFATACNKPFVPPYAPCPQAPPPIDVPIRQTVPEGIHTINADATTPGLASAATSTATLKVDRQAPLISAGGSFFAADGVVSSSTNYDFDIEATDSGPGTATSGIRKIELYVDDVLIKTVDNATQCAAAAGCPQTSTMDHSLDASSYGDGEHTAEVVVTDAAGNEEGETAAVDFAHVDPLPIHSIDVMGDSDGPVKLAGAQPGDLAGSSVANVGDLNDDGFDEVLVGAPGTDCLGRTDAGAAYLVFGTDADTSRVLQDGEPGIRMFCGAHAGDRAGTSVAAGGDVNGDEIMDLVVGAPGATLLGLQRGYVYVMFGDPAITSSDLGALGPQGLTINGPQQLVLPLGPKTSSFGTALATRKLGDAEVSGDVNGDDLDDLVIGDGRATAPTLIPGIEAGVTYVIYGRATGGTIDAANPGGGFRVFGAGLFAHSGESVTMVGDTTDDGTADFAITAPGADVIGRSSAGTAYMITATPSGDLDLATTANGVVKLLGNTADAIATAASVGDIDGDSNPDLLLGGHGALLALSTGEQTAVRDLAQPFDGFRMLAPGGAGFERAEVSGVGDIDGDYGSDLLIGFPGANSDSGIGYLVYGRTSITDLNLGALGGEQGSRLTASDGGVRLGAASAGLDQSRQEAPVVVAGAPRDAARGADAGSVTLITARSAQAPPLPIRATVSSRRRCYQRRSTAPAFPYDGRLRALPRCRRAKRGSYDIPAVSGRLRLHNPTPRCGRRSKTCQPAAFKAGNARVKDLELDTAGKLPLRDSLGDPLAYVEANGAKCFNVFRKDGVTSEGSTCAAGAPSDAYFEVQGRACMADTSPQSDEEAHYLVILMNPPPQTLNSGLQGFLPSSAFERPSRTKDRMLENAYAGCGYQPFRKRKGTAITLPTSNYFAPTDGYVGNKSYARCGDNPDPPPGVEACSGPYANYQGPQFDPAYAPLAISTTGVSGVKYRAKRLIRGADPFLTGGGGIVRAVIPRTGSASVRQFDEIGYVDPNVPCGQQRLAKWIFIQGNPNGDRNHKMFGWTPLRTPTGAPRNCP